MKKLLVILFLYLPIYTYSQGLSIEYSIGYGTYQLDDIKSLQNSILSYYGTFDLQVTDCFPSYMTQTLALGYFTGSNYLGSNLSYLTTGGRLNRTDYSGSFTADMILNGYRIGVFFRHYFKTPFPSLKLYAQLDPGFLHTNLKINEQLIINSKSSQITSMFNGLGIYFEPTVGTTYSITNYLQLSIGGGYEADFLGTLKYNGQSTQTQAHWNGLRLYGGLILILPA